MTNLADYLDQPYEVSIETLAMCNAACTFCPYPTLERIGTRLGIDVIIKLIDEMSTFSHPFFFSPFKVNEPLLDNRLYDICRAFNDRCEVGRLRLFTNGSPMTNGKLLDINRLRCVEHLWVSLNSTVPETYHALMGLKYEHTAARLDHLHAMVACGDFTHPVVLSAVQTPGFPVEEFHFECALRWPYFRVHLIKQDGWLGFVPPADPSIPDTPCVRWWELSITAEGIAALCCMDGKGEFPIGNIFESSLLNIYNSPFYRARRERLLSRRSVHPCATCTY